MKNPKNCHLAMFKGLASSRAFERFVHYKAITGKSGYGMFTKASAHLALSALLDFNYGT